MSHSVLYMLGHESERKQCQIYSTGYSFWWHLSSLVLTIFGDHHSKVPSLTLTVIHHIAVSVQSVIYWSLSHTHHLNQQTRCRTKDSGFYLCFFILLQRRNRHSHNNRRETAVRGRKVSPKQRCFTFVSFFPASHPHSFTISFSIYKILSFRNHAFLFALLLLLLYLCIREGETDVLKKEG